MHTLQDGGERFIIELKKGSLQHSSQLLVHGETMHVWRIGTKFVLNILLETIINLSYTCSSHLMMYLHTLLVICIFLPFVVRLSIPLNLDYFISFMYFTKDKDTCRTYFFMNNFPIRIEYSNNTTQSPVCKYNSGTIHQT